jgi:hypothetical protein
MSPSSFPRHDLCALQAIPKFSEGDDMATNGQQVYVHGPRGTGRVSVTGHNQDNIVSTWTGSADIEGNAFTKSWWFKGDVEVQYDLNGQTYAKKVEVPGSGPDTYDVYI